MDSDNVAVIAETLPASIQSHPAPPPTVRPKERLMSLDVFRGFTLLGMVLVNSHPGRIFPGLGHASWHGWGFADLIFPFFVFIVGVAMPYSFSNRLERSEGHSKIFLPVLRRCILLFAVGVFLNGYPYFDFSTLRVMNVLQRIAICYLLATILYVHLRLTVRSMVWLSATILVLYWGLMMFVPVPGYGAGVLQPVGNWGNYIDQLVMPGRLGHKTWESKSLLGCIPALVTMLMGLLTGIYLRTSRPVYEKLTHLFFYGALTMAAGVIWSAWFPINQHLWTSSLVLFMGGVAISGLAACYYIVDVKKVTWWTLPFMIFGVNSVAVWIFSQLSMKTLMAITTVAADGTSVSLWKAGGNLLSSYLGPMGGSFVFAVLFDLLWLAIMGILYWRRIYIKF
jgi:predicted acyltransferase